jgi:hypothetical protein
VKVIDRFEMENPEHRLDEPGRSDRRSAFPKRLPRKEAFFGAAGNRSRSYMKRIG